MGVDPRLEEFEAKMRREHPTLSESSVDFFVRRHAARLAIEDEDA